MKPWFFALLAAAAGCTDETALAVDVFTNAEWQKVKTLSPLPALPASPTNRLADSTRAAELGQKFFFDRALSGPIAVADDGQNGGLGGVGETGKISCNSCHTQTVWYQDRRSNPPATSLAADWGPRNAPTCVNVAFYRFFNWDASRDSLWSQATGPLENKVVQNSSRLEIAHTVFRKYRAEYDALFTPPLDAALDPASPNAARFPAKGKPKANATDPDGAWEMMAAADRTIVNTIFANVAKALEAYQRLLVSRNAAFDKYVAGDRAAITAAAKRGLRLFIGKANCSGCHSTPFFSDNLFHNTGLAQTGDHVPTVDNGHFDAIPKLLTSAFNADGAFSDDKNTGILTGLTQSEDARGKFRTKHLRQIGETAPYMHTGSLATLLDVVKFYNRGGDASGFTGAKDPLMVPLNLSAAEEADLVEFLKTLTGDPIPDALRMDTSNP
jgi:cytochrome c peroxidase